MKNDKFIELPSVAENSVVKANELIQKSRFNLTLQQQKIILYLISQISPLDTEFNTYEFDIAEFARICGIENLSGRGYTELKTAIKDIADKSLWVSLGKEETLLRWIDKPYINRRDGKIKIKLDNDMKPFLLQLKLNFTKYELIWTLTFRCKYSIRLYEFVKSIQFDKHNPFTKEYKLEELRRVLGAEKYKVYQDFKARAFLPAVEEINEKSDTVIEFEPIKNGRSVEKIKITVSMKDLVDRLRLQDSIEKELGLDQIKINFDEV
jgi:plasmid replication initiation protein